jgi:hypothetical protein
VPRHQAPDRLVARQRVGAQRGDAPLSGGVDQEAEQQRAHAAPLVRVGDGHRHFGRGAIARLANEARDADRAPRLGGQRHQRDVRAPVHLAQVAPRAVAQIVHLGEEPLVARLRREALERRTQGVAIAGTDAADLDPRPVAEDVELPRLGRAEATDDA